MYDICILIPTYKEEKNIRKLYYSIKKYTKNIKFFVLFIDDSPNYKTVIEIKKFFKKNKKIIHRIRKSDFSSRERLRYLVINTLLKILKLK